MTELTGQICCKDGVPIMSNGKLLDGSVAVLVVGMHRSGTSVVARGVNALGAHLGSSLLPAAPDNPKGFFEDADIVALNNEILAHSGYRWDVVPLEQFDYKSLDRFVPKATNLITRKFEGKKFWVIKDPRVSVLSNFWSDLIEKQGARPFFIWSLRHPIAVARSLESRDSFAIFKSVVLWLVYNTHLAMFFANHNGACRVVNYDMIVEDPKHVIEDIAGDLDISICGRVEKDVNLFCGDFLDPSLRRHCPEGNVLSEDPSGFLRDVVACYGRIKDASEPGAIIERIIKVSEKYAFLVNGLAYTEKLYLRAVNKLNDELIETKKDMLRLKSQLEWVNGIMPIRLWRYLKRSLSFFCKDSRRTLT